MAAAGSPGGTRLVMKSPRRAARSYTQLGNTGMGWVGFFLLCLSLNILRVTSAGYMETIQEQNLLLTELFTIFLVSSHNYFDFKSGFETIYIADWITIIYHLLQRSVKFPSTDSIDLK